MLVQLAELKPNPTRDFVVDPMIDQIIDNLEQSIKQDGFWGGVVCRRNSAGEIEIAAGHHRVAGAIRAGVKAADLFVSTDMDEVGLIRIYARENATQRGNSGTAQVGTVASAVRYLSKQALAGGQKSTTGNPALEFEKHGIGWSSVLDFLVGIPGVNKNTVTQQLAILKSSGDYSRIITEVVAEIERENAAEIAAMEDADRRKAEAEQRALETEADEAVKAKAKAEVEAATADAATYNEARKKRATRKKIKAKANEAEITFDLAGASEVLDHAGLLETFRKCVTSPGIQPYLQVKEQAKLARHLVKLAKERDTEITSRFISEHIASLVSSVKQKGQELKREEKERLLRANWNKQTAEYQHQFSRQATAMFSAAKKLAAHKKSRPPGVTLHATAELTKAIDCAKEALKIIEEKSE